MFPLTAHYAPEMHMGHISQISYAPLAAVLVRHDERKRAKSKKRVRRERNVPQPHRFGKLSDLTPAGVVETERRTGDSRNEAPLRHPSVRSIEDMLNQSLLEVPPSNSHLMRTQLKFEF